MKRCSHTEHRSSTPYISKLIDGVEFAVLVPRVINEGD